MSVSENKHNHYLHIAIIVLLLINIIINVISMKSAENIEMMKVWGKENYEKLQLIMSSDEYKAQYAQNLELMLQQIQGWGTEQNQQIDSTGTSTNGGSETLSWWSEVSGAQVLFDSNSPQGDE